MVGRCIKEMIFGNIETLLPFAGPVSDTFVLGVLRGCFTPEASYQALKERVLWTWGSEKYFEELQCSVQRLEEGGLVTIKGDKANPDLCTIHLVGRLD